MEDEKKGREERKEDSRMEIKERSNDRGKTKKG